MDLSSPKMINLRTTIGRHPLRWTCGLLLAFSLLIRIAHGLQYVVFGQDQARDAYLMSQYKSEGKWIVDYGPKASVANFYLPPFYYQVHNVASRITGENPLTMAWLIILVESCTPVILFLWLRMIVREKAALLGALLYTVSAGIIGYASFAWNPNMIPFFSTMAGFLWFSAIFKKKRAAIPMGVISLAIAISFHYQAIVLLPFAGLTFLITMRQDWKSIKYWLLGAVLSSLIFVPYLLAELNKHWQNTKAMLAFWHEERTRYFDRVSKVAFVMDFFPKRLERFVGQTNFSHYFVGRIVFFVGLLVAAVRTWVQKSRPKFLLLIYFLCIFVMFRVYKGDKVDYYLSTLYIFPAVLVAFIVEFHERFFTFFLVILAFILGMTAFALPPINGLKDIESASRYVARTAAGRPVRLLFQNQDYVNLFAFGLDRLGVTVDQKSTLVVDICGPTDTCRFDGRAVCVFSRPHTRSVAEKVASHYQEINEIEYPGAFRIVMGSEDVTPVRNTFPFYRPIGSAGSDKLFTQLYDQNQTQ